MNLSGLNGTILEYETVGVGEPVLLIHGTPVADAFRLMIAEEDLLQRYRFLHYYRRGYARAISKSETWATVADQARDAAELLRHVGIDRAHVVGYDMGGLIALQVALDAPQTVQSLALLEPLLMDVPSWGDVAPGIVPAIDLYRAGDRMGAVRVLLDLSGGPGCSDVLAAQLPRALERAARAAGAFFEEEFLAIGEWEMPPGGWAAIHQPVLSALGEHTLPFFREGRAVLHRHLPHCEDFDLFSASHLLQIENPEGMAIGLISFLARHPFR